MARPFYLARNALPLCLKKLLIMAREAGTDATLVPAGDSDDDGPSPQKKTRMQQEVDPPLTVAMLSQLLEKQTRELRDAQIELGRAVSQLESKQMAAIKEVHAKIDDQSAEIHDLQKHGEAVAAP